MYQIGIERRSPVGADNRSRTDHLDLGKVAFCQLNYVRKLQRWQPMRVLSHLPGPHARQRTPQLSRTSAHQPPALLQPSRIVRDRSSARLFRDGPDELPPGLFLLAETPRLAGYLDDLLQFVAHFLFPWLLPLLVGADGFEPPCLVRPDLQSGAFNRSATHPKTCLEKHKARSPVRSIRALWPSIFRSIGWSYPSPSGMLACLFQSLCSYPNGALIGQPAGDVPSTDDRARKDMAIACRLLVLPMVTRK
jgi:hypothetical protein